MGTIADSIVNGEICAFCTTPFQEKQGIPMVCNDCYTSDCGYPLANAEKNSLNLGVFEVCIDNETGKQIDCDEDAEWIPDKNNFSTNGKA